MGQEPGRRGQPLRGVEDSAVVLEDPARLFTQRAQRGSVQRKVEPVVYTAVERFDPEASPAWEKFVAWSQLNHLREVVSLDVKPCPNLFHERPMTTGTTTSTRTSGRTSFATPSMWPRGSLESQPMCSP